MATESATPRSQGYRMPAEWETHAATWLAWPHNANDWPGRFHPIPWVYCDIVRHLSRVEDVHLLVDDAAAEQRARGMLGRVGAQLDRVHFHQWPTNRVWLRDSGPIFITKAALRRLSPSPTGTSMPGRSTRTGNWTTSFL